MVVLNENKIQINVNSQKWLEIIEKTSKKEKKTTTTKNPYSKNSQLLMI